MVENPPKPTKEASFWESMVYEQAPTPPLFPSFKTHFQSLISCHCKTQRLLRSICWVFKKQKKLRDRAEKQLLSVQFSQMFLVLWVGFSYAATCSGGRDKMGNFFNGECGLLPLLSNDKQVAVSRRKELDRSRPDLDGKRGITI